MKLLPELLRRPFKGWNKPDPTQEQAWREAVERGDHARTLVSNPAFLAAFHDELDQVVADLLSEPGDSAESQARIMSLHARARELEQINARLCSYVGQAESAAEKLSNLSTTVE